MHQENPSDAEVADWLKTLGVESQCQWDMLIFLYRHQTTLVGSDYLAQLLGYATEAVVAALDVLASLGLVDRSRVSQGARFYQFTAPSSAPSDDAFQRLVTFAGHRAGRVALCRLLPRGDRSPQDWLETAVGSNGEVHKPVRASSPGRPDEGRKTWRQAM
jgi:hypothetical protein